MTALGCWQAAVVVYNTDATANFVHIMFDCGICIAFYTDAKATAEGLTGVSTLRKDVQALCIFPIPTTSSRS